VASEEVEVGGEKGAFRLYMCIPTVEKGDSGPSGFLRERRLLTCKGDYLWKSRVEVVADVG